MGNITFDSWEEFVVAAKDYCDKGDSKLLLDISVLQNENSELDKEVERLNDELTDCREQYYSLINQTDQFKMQVQELSMNMLKRLVRTKTDVFLELLVWLYPSFEYDKINKIKFVREIMKWGLKDSKEFVETGILPPIGADDNGLPQYDQVQIIMRNLITIMTVF